MAFDLILNANRKLAIDENDFPIANKVTRLFIKDCPNINGLTILRLCPNLTHVRINIGTVYGSLYELEQYKTLQGLNDSINPQLLPRLVGEWHINDWYTPEQLASVTGKFDGLTIVEDLNYKLDYDNFAVQTLDSTKPNYNPAVAIILESHNVGNVLQEPVIQGGGRYVLAKSQAAAVQNIGTNYNNVYFGGITTVTDTNGIVTSDTTATYDFTSFNEFEYFTGVTSLPNCDNFVSLGKGTFTRCAKLQQIKLPNTITNLGTGSFAECPLLTEIIIPTGVTVIPEACFAYSSCEVITHNNITIFKDNAFTCSNATATVYPTIDKFPANFTYLGKQEYTHIYKNDYTLPISCVNIAYSRGFKGNATIGQAVHWLPEMITITGIGTGGSSLVWFFEAVSKVYVGNGSSAGHDNGIVENYKSKFPNGGAALNKFDSWYNFAAPQISWNGTDVTMSVVRDSTIFYTTDGTVPTRSSNKYTSPFTWDGTGVIKAMGIDAKDDAVYATPFYSSKVSTPVITHTNDGIQITSEQGATIYYTLDGTSPYLNGIEYTGTITSNEDIVKVRCYATLSGKNDSDENQEFVVLNDALWGADGDSSYFAIQSIDSTKHNFNPLPLSKLYQQGFVNSAIINKHGFITKTEAANIAYSTAFTFNGLKTQDNISKKLFNPNDTYSFTSFEEFKYFTGLTQLPGYCFQNTNLQSLVVPENIKTVGPSTFATNTLVDITGIGLTTIGGLAFAGSSFHNIIIPNYVENTALTNFGSSANPGTLCVKSLRINNNRKAYSKRVLVTYNIGDAASGGIGTGLNSVEEIRVLNNCTGGPNGGLCLSSAGTLKFIEIMNDIPATANANLNIVTSAYSGVILHLGKAGVVSETPNVIGLNNNGAVSDIYIGPGINEAGDQSIIDSYRANSNWGQNYTLKTWWSYNGVYKTYRMDDSDAISNSFMVQNYHGSAWDETCYDGYFFGLKKEGQLMFDISVPLGHSASECHISMWDMTVATPSESDITNSVCTVESSDIDTIIHVNIPVIKGNVSITIS